MKRIVITLISILLFSPLAFAGSTVEKDSMKYEAPHILDNGATVLILEGATRDAYETSIVVTDPTADRTITLPDGNVTLPTLTSTDTNTTFTIPISSGTSAYIAISEASTTHGLMYWSSGADPLADSGNEVCLRVGLTCSDVFMASGTDMTCAAILGARFNAYCY